MRFGANQVGLLNDLLASTNTVMEFLSRSRRLSKETNKEYHSRLQIFRIPPLLTIKVEEFEELARRRLKLLQEVEREKQLERRKEHTSHDARKQSEGVYLKQIIAACKQYQILATKEDRIESQSGQNSLPSEERRNNYLSHYILRLAYCRNEEMRRWFLTQETELLKCLFLWFYKDRNDFFEQYKDEFCFNMVTISEEEKQLSQDIRNFYQMNIQPAALDGNEPQPQNSHQFYKLPFTAALDLIQSRQVVVKQGFVYIPANKADMIVSMVCNKFRSRLSEELVKTLHHLSVVDDDERISPFLKKLKYRYLGEDFSSGSHIQGGIQLSQINTLAKESFPPCMRHLHETLRKDHHLKHFARLQYGLFLKSIGVTMDQALTLWRTEFVKKIEPDKFEKQYAYNIRHTYGKEGKRANYSPYSCVKIIMGNSPGQGDSHGCPFKHWDEEHIQNMLTSHGVPHNGVRQITSYLQEHHYQLACQKYFEVTHGIASAPFSLEHPNQFYLESRSIRVGEAVKQEHTQVQGAKEEKNEFDDVDLTDFENMET